MAKWLTLDLETRSALDLGKVGVFKYADHPSTSIWCMSYAFDDGPVQRWIPVGTPLPNALRKHISTGGLLRAWNAQFESTMWPLLGTMIQPAPEQWVCSAALAARCGLPRSLEYAAEVLGVPFQKDKDGHRLMKKMCVPTNFAGDGAWTWNDKPADLERLQAYCDQDVETERAVFNALPDVGHALERKLWLLDQTINRRGIQLDRDLVTGMLAIGTAGQDILNSKMEEVTDGAVQKTTHVARLLAWAQAQGVKVTALDKGSLRDILVGDQVSGAPRHALTLRQKGSKTSLAKLTTMLNTVQEDGRIRGSLLYYAASTGRWGGRGIQPQNFPRPTCDVTEDDIAWMKLGKLKHPPKPVMALLASALRSCLVAAPGKEFTVADFAQIEARVLAWLAGCTPLLDLFRRGESPYLHMGRVIFNREIDKKADPTEYHISKGVVLGCGYQMGAEKFRTQMKDQAGLDISEEISERAVRSYRETYYHIPQLWKAMNATAQIVVRTGAEEWTRVAESPLAFRMDGAWLRMRLPSGRSLWYARPRIRSRKTPWGHAPAVVVEGVDSLTKRWHAQALYGGLLTENATQAIARDILGEAMLRLEEAGYPVVSQIHDEIVSEHPEGFGSVDEFVALMIQTPDWAGDCPVNAEGWRGNRWRK